jgi:uncharacterized membrane protein YsdA (DUF1294 family)
MTFWDTAITGIFSGFGWAIGAYVATQHFIHKIEKIPTVKAIIEDKKARGKK